MATERVSLCKTERVLVTGASGGVGSAAVQLSKRRGAEVIALASKSKMADVLARGADQVIERNADLVTRKIKQDIRRQSKTAW